MKIAIVGVGITGTAAAYFLSRSGHDVTLIEKAPELAPIGAGIMVQPSGQTILNLMGILNELKSCSTQLVGMTAQLTSGRRLIQLRFPDLNPGFHAIGAHRGRLFRLLLQKSQDAGAKLLVGHNVVGFHDQGASSSQIVVDCEYEQNQIELGPFDLLIGADGIRSTVRQQLENDCAIRTRFREYDYAALWTTVKTEYRSNELFQTVEGTQKLIGILPIGQEECSFFWGLKASSFDDLKNSEFDGWKAKVIADCPQAESLLNQKNGFDDFTFGRYGDVQVNRFSVDKVVLLGDAAHATSPHLGQGANLGLEDAYQFATAVSETESIEDACRRYAKIQLNKIRYYQRLTRVLSPFFQSRGRVKGMLRDCFLPWFPYLPFVRTEMLRTLCGQKAGWFR